MNCYGRVVLIWEAFLEEGDLVLKRGEARCGQEVVWMGQCMRDSMSLVPQDRGL